jgi:hypothetical protein
MTILLRYKDVDPQTLNPHIFVATGERHIYPNETTGKTLTREALNAYVSSQIEAGKPAYLNAVVLASDTYTDASDTSNSKLPAVICRIPGFDAVPPPTKLHCQGTSPSDQNIANGIFYKLSGFLTQGIIAADWNAIFNHTLYLTYGGSGGDLNLVPGNVVKVTFSDFEMKSRPEILGLNTDIAFIFPEYQTTSPREAHKPAPPTPKPEPTQKPEEEPEEPPQTTPAETPAPTPLPTTGGPFIYGKTAFRKEWSTGRTQKVGTGPNIMLDRLILGSNGKPKYLGVSGARNKRYGPSLKVVLPIAREVGVHPAVIGGYWARESNGGDPSVYLLELHTVYAQLGHLYGYAKKPTSRKASMGTVARMGILSKRGQKKWRGFCRVTKNQQFANGPPFTGTPANRKGVEFKRIGYKSGCEYFNAMWHAPEGLKQVAIHATSFGQGQILGGYGTNPAYRRRAKVAGLDVENMKLHKILRAVPGSWKSEAAAEAFMNYFLTDPWNHGLDLWKTFAFGKGGYTRSGPKTSDWYDASQWPFDGRTERMVQLGSTAAPYTWRGKTTRKESMRRDKRVDTWFILQAKYGGSSNASKMRTLQGWIRDCAKYYDMEAAGPPVAWK